MIPTRRLNPIVPLLAGLLPVIAISTAYLINIYENDLTACMPFWSGCISISRAARSGPGLMLFKALTIPAAVFMAVSWVYIVQWLRSGEVASEKTLRTILWLGITGAAFMALYVINLGLDGTMYHFMRRFGVTVFFGCTVISQLLLTRSLWASRSSMSPVVQKPVDFFAFVVCLEWLLGVFATVKRLVISDPDRLNQVENLSEWWFALLLACTFVLLAWIFAGVNSADG